jgi:hypothetical protein
MILEVRETSVCGRMLYYAVNEQARKLLDVFENNRGKRKVFTNEELRKLMELGYVVNIERAKA